MLPVESVLLRREILKWRDRHFDKTHDRLALELSGLFSALDAQIEKMDYNDIVFHGAEYSRRQLQPLYNDWVEREIKEIVEDAEADLRRLSTSKSFQFTYDLPRQVYNGNSSCGREVATATISGAGALIAIPAFASWSVVSAGGIAGWLGVTVISWPVVMTGVAIGVPLLALSGSKWANLKENVHKSIKKNTRNSIRPQVLGNTNNDSICQRLHAHLERVADAILEEIPPC